MATALVQLDSEQCICLPATWETYLELLKARGERRRPRYIFLDGRLTVVSPGQPHESWSMRLVVLIHEILLGVSIDYHPTRSVTLHRSRRSREGTEADLSYYLTNI